MPLAEPLLKEWRAAPRAALRALEMTPEGVVLGKTMLAPLRQGNLVIDRKRITAMLSVAYGGHIASALLKSFRHAGRCWKRGDKALAQMHLALTGLHGIDLDQAQRLFAAEWALNRGVSSGQLLKIAGLRKDDDDEDDDDSDDDESDDGDDGGDSSDFDAEHPRWPAGSPGGIGGEFAPKDGSIDAVPSGQGNISAGDMQNESSNAVTSVESYEPAAFTTTQIAPSSATDNNAGDKDGNSQNSAQLPDFADLWINYPTYVMYPTVFEQNNPDATLIWNLIGGHVLLNSGNPSFLNSCAIRMSYALNQSGYPIAYDGGATISGADGNWYYYRVNDLADYLQNTYGAPGEYSPSSWETDLTGQTGIVLFQQHFRDANGHFELFDGSHIINSNDPSESHDYSSSASRILFWRVK